MLLNFVGCGMKLANQMHGVVGVKCAEIGFPTLLKLLDLLIGSHGSEYFALLDFTTLVVSATTVSSSFTSRLKSMRVLCTFCCMCQVVNDETDTVLRYQRDENGGYQSYLSFVMGTYMSEHTFENTIKRACMLTRNEIGKDY